MKNNFKFSAYKNNNLMFLWEPTDKETFNLFEKTYVELAIKYKLVDLPLKYYENSLDGLRLRRSFVLSERLKKTVYKSSCLTDDERYVLDVFKKNNFVLEGKEKIEDFVSRLKTASVDCLEDIMTIFEDLDDVRRGEINKFVLERIR